METLHKVINAINGVLWDYALIYLLFAVGIYFTLRFGFLQFRGLKRAAKVSFAKVGPGEISSFQAFATGLASRVGTGNIAGVATAISIGGPGAVFWMWLTALLGMSSAFVEATLAQIFKVKTGDGTFRGGPAYYIQQGLGSRAWGIAFAISLLLAFGLVFNAVQSNTISDALNTGFGINKTLTGIILVALSGAVIFGGVRRIGNVAKILVPIMAIAYLLVALYAVLTHLPAVPGIFMTIITHAFSGEAAVGGFAGSAMKQAAEMGIKRGLFSNEAGMGSAPNAAASASTPHPVNQGLLQMLGVFIDTIVICSATAFIILLSDAYAPGNGAKGVALTQSAVEFHIGSGGAAFIAAAVFLFAFTSIIGNYAYAESNINFIKNCKYLRLVFRLMVLGMVMFGAVGSLPMVWDMADASMGFMAMINLIAIVLLSKYAISAWKDYSAQLKSGIKDPIFKSANVPELQNKLSDDCWK